MSFKRKLNWHPSPDHHNLQFKMVTFSEETFNTTEGGEGGEEDEKKREEDKEIKKNEKKKEERKHREITRQGPSTTSTTTSTTTTLTTSTKSSTSSSSSSSSSKVVKSSSVVLPLSVDLSSNCSPVKDQGDEGSCVAFATIGAMEYLQKKILKRVVSLSERFTYYVTRVNIEKAILPPGDTGTYIVDALKSVVDYGTCLNVSFPSNGNYTLPPPLTAFSEALKYEVITYAKLPDITTTRSTSSAITTLKANLNAGYPIIAGFTCFSNIIKSSGGIIPLPTKNDTIIGGHAVLITGYDDTTQMFTFKNSWGLSWGSSGYGKISYQYYLKGYMTDLWSIYTGEINDVSFGGGSLSISNPLINAEITKNELTDVFADVMSNLTTASNPKTSLTFFNSLVKKYNNPKLSIFLEGLQPLLSNFVTKSL